MIVDGKKFYDYGITTGYIAFMAAWFIENFITLKSRQNGRHFAYDIFKCFFLNANLWIVIQISIVIPINNNTASVQILAGHRPDAKPFSEPMMVSLSTNMCVTRPQYVKYCQLVLYQQQCKYGLGIRRYCVTGLTNHYNSSFKASGARQ